MGNCSTKRSLIVEFLHESKQKPGGFSEFAQVKQWVAKEFPSLRCQSFAIFLKNPKNQIIKDGHDYRLAVRKGPNCLRVQVCKQEPIRFSDPSLEKYRSGIVKLREINCDLEATGLILSPKYLLTTREQIRQRAHLKYYSILCDQNQFNFETEGVYIEVGSHFVVVEIQSIDEWVAKCQEFVFCQFQPEIQNINQEGTVLFYTKKRPILQQQKGHVVLMENRYFQLVGQPLREGSSGSPVLDDSGKLIGVCSVYLEEASGVLISQIVQSLKALLETGSQREIEAIQEIFSYSNRVKNHNKSFKEDSSQSYEQLIYEKIKKRF